MGGVVQRETLPEEYAGRLIRENNDPEAIAQSLHAARHSDDGKVSLRAHEIAMAMCPIACDMAMGSYSQEEADLAAEVYNLFCAKEGIKHELRLRKKGPQTAEEAAKIAQVVDLPDEQWEVEIAQANSAFGCKKKMNELCAEGYEPIGGIVKDGGNFAYLGTLRRKKPGPIFEPEAPVK